MGDFLFSTATSATVGPAQSPVWWANTSAA